MTQQWEYLLADDTARAVGPPVPNWRRVAGWN